GQGSTTPGQDGLHQRADADQSGGNAVSQARLRYIVVRDSGNRSDRQPAYSQRYPQEHAVQRRSRLQLLRRLYRWHRHRRRSVLDRCAGTFPRSELRVPRSWRRLGCMADAYDGWHLSRAPGNIDYAEKTAERILQAEPALLDHDGFG